jgi:hypothetical protein
VVRLGEGEPAAGPWRVEQLADFVADLRAAAGSPLGRPPVVAVDGRSSSGKTTLAGRIGTAVPGAAIVHTDDLAWWYSAFGWAELLVDGVLRAARRGEAVSYRPPGWVERDRPGAVEVPAGPALLIVEGVGAGRTEVAHLLDLILYVQSDLDVAERRDAARVAAGEISPSAHARWMAEERTFVARQRPWSRAWAVIAGAPDLTYDPASEVVVAPGPLAASPRTSSARRWAEWPCRRRRSGTRPGCGR